jgi:menaquinone-dependent protoporphyrinogen IX oxidase
MTEEKLDDYTAVMIAEGVEEADYHRTVEAWQYLHDTGLAYRLQGFFGRTAKSLIDQGIIG